MRSSNTTANLPAGLLSFILLFSLTLASGAARARAAAWRATGPAAPTNRNGDAFADLIVGIPGEDFPGSPSIIADAGRIQAIYGLPSGLSPGGNQTFDQGTVGSEDQREADDFYGQALASGDFNGDGYYDLAIGVPSEDLTVSGSPVLSAGAVHVIYGSATDGLSISGDQIWHQASLNIDGSAEYNDQFGRSLAVGNFNGDEYDDLAIGVPYEDFEYGSTVENAGSVVVIYGSAGGLSPIAVLPDQMWHQDRTDIADQVEEFDWFGFSLAAGDFDDDDYDDLAIGAPGEDAEAASKDDIGVVHVLYGTTSGLTAARSQQWEQYDWGGSAESESYDHFGWSLAVGVFKALGPDDLAIGVPDENIENGTTVTDAGAVNILYGSSTGLNDSIVDFIYQDGGYIDEQAEYLDRFGYTLAAVDFGGTGVDDLAVGVPFENVGDPEVTDAGLVHVLLYQASHWVGSSIRTFHQGRPNIPDGLEAGDKFGFSLAPGDYNGDGKEDLAIGVPYDSCTHDMDGSVVVIYENYYVPAPAYEPQYWCQGGGLADQNEANDYFGLALVALPSSGAAPYRIYLPIAARSN